MVIKAQVFETIEPSLHKRFHVKLIEPLPIDLGVFRISVVTLMIESIRGENYLQKMIYEKYAEIIKHSTYLPEWNESLSWLEKIDGVKIEHKGVTNGIY
jgi:hypothetical protein